MTRPAHRRFPLALITVALCALTAAAQPVRHPVILDTDIGNDVDDGLALALLLASPELDVRGVTTVGADPDKRALLTCRFLTMTGRRAIPVAAGRPPAGARAMAGQHQYYYHPDVLFNRTTRPVKESAAEFLAARVQAQPGKVTVVAAGPLTNLAKFVADHPKAATQVGRIIVSGGCIPADVPAAKVVFASGIPLVVLPADVASGLKMTAADRVRVFAPLTPLSLQTQALYQLGDEPDPRLVDVLAAALCVDDRFCEFEDRYVVVDAEGDLRIGNLKPNARLVARVKADEFRAWYVDRMAGCVKPSANPARPVARGNLPNRVHVAEDYDLDIERRWWMAGKAEAKTLAAPDRVRACRGVLTHDFDDLLGNPKAMWTAVIFNPVPGPPMGKNPRLGFRVWLDGAPELRVQIYSLTNGYHRHLMLKDLPQRVWQDLTVDMTHARRPDGTGGPLAEGERIDDIQFYVEPTADLIVDDVVLYDAAAPGEERPFPRKVHFTGWFDSGAQGKEWPGVFEIAKDNGFFWHAARAAPDAGGGSVIRLDLRGPRPLGGKTHLTFRYHLTGGDGFRVGLVDAKGPPQPPVSVKPVDAGRWVTTTLDLTAATQKTATEIRFDVPKGAELLVDDVMLYEP